MYGFGIRKETEAELWCRELTLALRYRWAGMRDVRESKVTKRLSRMSVSEFR